VDLEALETGKVKVNKDETIERIWMHPKTTSPLKNDNDEIESLIFYACQG
jgi:hypothetical protein